MLTNNSSLYDKKLYSNSSLNSKEPIFKIKKLKRKGLFEKKSMIISNMLGTGKWTSKEKEKFIYSCYVHGPKWKKVNIGFINHYRSNKIFKQGQ